MKYDDASWHYEGDFPAELPREAGATHIGMFLAWAVDAGLVSEEFEEDHAEEVEALRAREITGREFLLSATDGTLSDEDLSEEGNAFAGEYYLSDRGQYLSDYIRALVPKGMPSVYHVADTWENFDRLKPVLDHRLAEWRAAAQSGC